jgi:hypothetical protein
MLTWWLRKGYEYKPSQPYINTGVGYGIFPTFAMASGAKVRACVYWHISCLLVDFVAHSVTEHSFVR